VARKWFKIWIEEWDTGSIRVYMDSAERGFWVDLIGRSLKGRLEGFICRDSKGELGYSNEELATDFRVPVSLVESTISKRLRDGSIKIHPNNVIEIINIWKFQSKLDKNDNHKNTKQSERDPISKTIQDAKDKKRAATLAITQEQTVIDQLAEKGKRVSDSNGEVIKTTSELQEEHGQEP
jgi:hypothetical protein